MCEGPLWHHRAGQSSLLALSSLIKKAGPEQLIISWDETFRLAAEKCSACPPDRFKMIISGDCSAEDLFVAGKFTRDALKSDQIYISGAFIAVDDASPRYRLLKKSQPLDVLAGCSTILCLGLNGDFSSPLRRSSCTRPIAAGQKSLPSILAATAQLSLRISGCSLFLAKSLTCFTTCSSLTRDLDVPVLPGVLSTDRPSPVLQASQLLKTSANPVIVLAPSLFNPEICAAVEMLSDQINARVIVIPEGNHLVGNLTLASHSQPGAVSNHPRCCI